MCSEWKGSLFRELNRSHGHEYSVRIEIYQFCTSEVCEQYFAIFFQCVISFQQIIARFVCGEHRCAYLCTFGISQHQ